MRRGAVVLPDDDAAVKAAKGAAAEEKVAVFERIRMSCFACAGWWRRPRSGIHDAAVDVLGGCTQVVFYPTFVSVL
jgi:Cu+-exporting ATPase